MKPQIAVVDYGMGNRRSVEKALEHVGAQVAVTPDADVLRASAGVVIPGVGAFPEAMSRLQALGLVDPLRNLAAQGTPILGICLGMQLLFDTSQEIESTPGLGLLPGSVTWLHTSERLPHIGWNEVRFRRPSPLTAGLPAEGCPFYHVHSLAARPGQADDVVGSTTYGETFATIVERDRVAGVQFHPEKSSGHGLRLLANYVGLCAGSGGGQSRTGRPGMILVPAIDIMGGQAVRLTRGAFDERTDYDADPVEAAVRWESGGARALHVVDLDGAREGAPANLDVIRRIAERVRIPFQVGGGVRSAEAVQQVVEAGASRVVLGTAALGDVDLLDTAVETLGDRLVVSIDVRDRRLATKGWTDEMDIPLEAVIQRLGGRGVRRFVYSSIDRDGTLTGPDLDAARLVAQSVRGTFYYSGGVSTLDDLRALAGLRQVNLTGVIVGKALYEQRFSVQEARDALAQSAHSSS